MAGNEYKAKYYVKPEDIFSELNNYMLVDGFDFVLDLEKSTGSILRDARNGKEFIDFFTCFASMPIGMNHPKMLNDEYIHHLGVQSLNKPSNSDIYTDTMATFVKTFHSVAHIDKFKYSFYISGGALAVENALKAAFDWKVRKNFQQGIIKEEAPKIIHFKQAFHGRSGYTMSLTNTDPNKVKYFPKFDWPRVTTPKITFPINGENLEKVINLEKQAIAEIEKAFNDNKDNIAAIILEPIQGEGGDNHFRNEFFKELRRLCDENDALLIFDEVQTGVGITGKWWAHQHTDVVPDIMSFGKKMQVCGIVAGPKIDEVDDNVFKVSSRINSTWGANLVDMARSTRYLEIIDEENLVDNAAKMGEVLIDELYKFNDLRPDLVSNVRGKGLFCAFDLPNQDIRAKFSSECYDNGLIILPCGEKSIRFRPPLNINNDQLSQGLDIVSNALKKI